MEYLRLILQEGIFQMDFADKLNGTNYEAYNIRQTFLDSSLFGFMAK